MSSLFVVREHLQQASDLAAILDACGVPEVATGLDLGFYAARSYSLMRPPRMGRRLIRSRERSATG
jgi:hypothetical protein